MASVKEVYKTQLEMASVRLVKDAPLMSKNPIKTPEDAVKVLGKYLCQMDREVICVINLRTDGCPINCSVCSMGAIDQAVTHPREILKTAILSNATSMVLMHNHPSSNLTPSKDDTMLTDRLVTVCEIIGIPLVDHIIVGGNNSEYFSFREKGVLPMKALKLKGDFKELEMEGVHVAEDHVSAENTDIAEARPRRRSR